MHRSSYSRRSRSNRIALSGMLAACAATLILGYLSLLWTVMFAAGDWVVGIRTGTVILRKMPNSHVGRAFGIVEFWPIEGGKVYDILSQSGGRFPPATVQRSISLWLLLAIMLVPTVVLWLRRESRPKAGQCRTCRYDLTGTMSSRCPECGTVVATPGSLIMGSAASSSGPRLPT